ncbi:MAG: LPXTG cell wall anchor domain-containing protein, partial [Oscillospiraceae bacterium]|nr:LPXTG cell wall anchor domain-containing protein [Oscillospiraceae bacterium]
VCTGYAAPEFEINRPEGGIVIDLTKGENEANPETGAPVHSGTSVIAGITVLSAAAFVMGKRK